MQYLILRRIIPRLTTVTIRLKPLTEYFPRDVHFMCLLGNGQQYYSTIEKDFCTPKTFRENRRRIR